MKYGLMFVVLAIAALNGCASNQRMSIFDIPPGQTYIATRSGDDWELRAIADQQRMAPRRENPHVECITVYRTVTTPQRTVCSLVYPNGRRVCIPPTTISTFRH